MPLTVGKKIGPYEITSALGSGGMGEVYRARDTKLNREVALKVLPETFANDPQRMARFEREAQVLASLNHPNIAAIYGLEESGTVRALVMELVEGETLAERISVAPSFSSASAHLKVGATTAAHRAALQLDESLAIAKQVAEALEYAHERGIVHRDLKPANIKITPEGTVKVLDFGLAKALEPGAGSDAGAQRAVPLQESPTLSLAMTQAGFVIGTAAYMSPEQAKGKPVDRRTDIWAFGCVLYEMFSGKKAFDGETVSDVLAAVIMKDPDWTALPESTPPRIQELVRRCLQKAPKQRLQAIGDARIAIEETLSGEPSPFVPLPRAGEGVPTASRQVRVSPLQRALPWAVAGIAVAALIVVIYIWKFSAAATRSPMHFSAVTNFAGVQAEPAISPDGRSVAFVSNRGGNYNIYVGLVLGGNLVQITHDPNLESAPQWSPDGATLAYARLNHSGLWDIWEVPALGGTPRRLILNAMDPAWSPDGHSLAYENMADGAIWISGISGESPHQVVPKQGNWLMDTEPRFSPDGGRLAFVVRSLGPYGELGVADLDSGKSLLLTHDLALALSPAWSPDGKFIYFASSRGGTMNIWKISATGRDLEQITSGQGDDAQLSMASDGTRIVFSTWRENMNIARLDLDAKPGQLSLKLLTTDPARNQVAPVYSPDGKHIAYFSNLKGIEKESIWVADADGSNSVQMVKDDRINIMPRWAPDSEHLIYFSEPVAAQSDTYQYRRVAISGGAPEAILKIAPAINFDVGADDRLLFKGPKGQVKAFDPRDNSTRTLATLPTDEDWGLPSWSPDQRSVAYIVDASREDDPKAGLWVDDFKSPPRQIFRGWVAAYARGSGNEIYLLEGKPDSNAILWRVGWDGQGLERTSATIPMTYSYWATPGRNSQDHFDISPDGRYVAFDTQAVLQANIGMIENVR